VQCLLCRGARVCDRQPQTATGRLIRRCTAALAFGRGVREPSVFRFQQFRSWSRRGQGHGHGLAPLPCCCSPSFPDQNLVQISRLDLIVARWRDDAGALVRASAGRTSTRFAGTYRQHSGLVRFGRGLGTPAPGDESGSAICDAGEREHVASGRGFPIRPWWAASQAISRRDPSHLKSVPCVRAANRGTQPGRRDDRGQ